MLVGHETFDDAGVFRLSDDVALVQTVDFFAPIVDDPYTFGQIAAANALSDVYAMGGTPLTAMNIVGFPRDDLPMSVLGDILRGGHDKVREAGAVVVGGHSIIDSEVKFGLSVTGVVHPDRIMSNAGARVGDRLVLTKPVGTGLLATAGKAGRLGAAETDALHRSMATLNAAAAAAAVDLGVRCATDITGFGLLGHARHIGVASGVTLRIDPARVPMLDGVAAVVEKLIATGGAARNAEYLEPQVEWRTVTPLTRAVFLDPQTSGGLLLAIPADRVGAYLSRVSGAVEIGEVVDAGTHPVIVG